MALRKGLDEVQKVIEKGANRTSGARKFFKWNPGEEKYIRFLSEGSDIVVIGVHEYVKTPDGGHRSFVCRQEFDAKCELCADPDIKKRELGYGVAIERVLSKDDDGVKRMRTKTEVVEEEVDGKTVTREVPVVAVMQQAPTNFWGFFWAAYERYGTLLDRDYSVTRHGKNKDTKYTMFQDDPSPLDLSKFDEFKPDIEEFLEYIGSAEYYDKYLHGEGGEYVPGSNADDADAEAAEALDKETLKKLNDSLKSESASSGAFD